MSDPEHDLHRLSVERARILRRGSRAKTIGGALAGAGFAVVGIGSSTVGSSRAFGVIAGAVMIFVGASVWLIGAHLEERDLRRV